MNPRIDKESVRLLAMQIGIKATADKLGLSYGRLRQWSSRYGWNKTVKTPTHPTVTAVTQPSTVLENELNALGKQTRLSLAKGVQRMAKDSESATLRHAPYVHKAAQTAAIVHGWNEPNETKNTILNLGVLIGQTELQDVPKQLPSESNNQETVIDLE